MSEETLSANIDPIYAWTIVLSAFLISGLAYTAQAQSGNLVSFILVGSVVAFLPWIALTESGAQWFMEQANDSSSSGNSQTVSTETETSRSVVCTSCGWQNDQNNNYCNDCGDELFD